MKFMVGYRRGEYEAEDIDDFVDRWHTTETRGSLPSYLGMTFAEYTAWVEGRKSLEDMKDVRHSVPPPRPGLIGRILGWLLVRICGLPG